MNLRIGDNVIVEKTDIMSITGRIVWIKGETVGVEVDRKLWEFPIEKVKKLNDS